METPSQDKVFEEVKYLISLFSQYPIDSLEDTFELKKAPLRMDNSQLGRLARALNAYVQNFKNTNVYAQEVRKSKVTVTSLCKIVFKKMK